SLSGLAAACAGRVDELPAADARFFARAAPAAFAFPLRAVTSSVIAHATADRKSVAARMRGAKLAPADRLRYLRPMRAVVLIAFVLVAVMRAPDARADGANGVAGEEKGVFGLGLMVGEPTGICAKLYLKDDQAVQGA